MKRWAAILALAGLLALAYCTFQYFRASSYQTAAKNRIASTSPTRAKPNAGDAVAMLTIPRIGVSSVILEGAGARELSLGPGHIANTPLPG